ncbi:helix-turn-helix domain-containing protein [Enterorhabdus mucosicola]|uniref:Helix-turn-helix domain-containing protein n=2 Tax=Adlercreutzia mucosicola TaxID=580026 RepID=A0A6N8JRG0_9ACTN|nr:helix-turn-helix domain-containing protein [Adlercreutzia mucosicola]
MQQDLRCRHDVSIKRTVAKMVDDGSGWGSISSALAPPRDTARQWAMIYRAVGMDGLLNMGSKKKTYDYETRLAAARAHVDDGRTLQDVMAAYGVASRAPVQRWCRLYREGGAEALRPKPKGRPPGSRARPAPKTREQELEERVRKLEAENAYLKKLAALRAEKRLRTGKRPR